MNDDLILLHLSLLDGIGPKTVLQLLEKRPVSFKLSDLYRCSKKDFVHTFSISPARADTLFVGLADRTKLEQECSLLEKHQIKWMSIKSDLYPSLLKEIYLPPIIMYWRGAALHEAEQRLAIVGARRMNMYGERIIRQIVPELVQFQWTIVSGGAIGVDSYAHRITVNSGGKAVVILGSGLLRPYPMSNEKLFEQIIEKGGTIMSSFPLCMEAVPGNFPARNRIISGLSRGCVIVQAAERSGAKITAHCALEQGRDVFAVPGPIDDVLSVGCHRLIQQGAKLTCCATDILEEFDMIPGKEHKKECCSFTAIGANSLENSIIESCSSPVAIDELAEQTTLSLPELHDLLFDMQLKGMIKQNSFGMFERC